MSRLLFHTAVNLSVTSLNQNVTFVKQHKHLSMTGETKISESRALSAESSSPSPPANIFSGKNMSNDGLHKTCKKVETTKTALAFLHFGPRGFADTCFGWAMLLLGVLWSFSTEVPTMSRLVVLPTRPQTAAFFGNASCLGQVSWINLSAYKCGRSVVQRGVS